MQYTHILIIKQNEPVSPSPAIQRKAIFTLSHSLQTSVERGSEKDLAITYVLAPAVNPSQVFAISCYSIVLPFQKSVYSILVMIKSWINFTL